MDSDPDPVEYPITEELDLHMFRPNEVFDVLHDYLDLARERGFQRVRIVHGKGIGTQRTMVHEALAKRDDVTSYQLDDGRAGGWGATWVDF